VGRTLRAAPTTVVSGRTNGRTAFRGGASSFIAFDIRIPPNPGACQSSDTARDPPFEARRGHREASRFHLDPTLDSTLVSTIERVPSIPPLPLVSPGPSRPLVARAWPGSTSRSWTSPRFARRGVATIGSRKSRRGRSLDSDSGTVRIHPPSQPSRSQGVWTVRRRVRLALLAVLALLAPFAPVSLVSR